MLEWVSKFYDLILSTWHTEVNIALMATYLEKWIMDVAIDIGKIYLLVKASFFLSWRMAAVLPSTQLPLDEVIKTNQWQRCTYS